MNEFYFLCFLAILFIIDEIGYFIIDILNLVFTIWTKEKIRNYVYFYFTFCCIRIIQLAPLPIIAMYDNLKKLLNNMGIIFAFLYFFFILFWVVYLIIITINFFYFKSYLKNCPFTISDLDYNLHMKRRCELYNINYSSRYCFQYICNYDSSKDFKNKLTYEIRNNLICIPLKNIIENSNEIKLFINEYKNEKKFYCSGTTNPKKDKFIKSKNCDKKKYKYMITLLILSYLRILFIFWPLFTAFLKTDDANNFNPFIINNLDISSQSTNISEMPNENNENFERQKTQNIIIENKKEFTINVDIKNFELKNKIDTIESTKDEKTFSIDNNMIDSKSDI